MDELPSSLLCLFVAQADVTSHNGGSILLRLVAVLFLVAANGFFVAAEFALVGVRASRIETLAATGSRSAQRLLRQLRDLNAYLSACQLGVTLASLALGWIGEPAVARILESPLSGLSETLRHGIAFAIAFSIITSLHIVLGEQAPKLMGLAQAERVALAIALPLQIFYRIFSLPIRALDWASARTVKLVGIEATGEYASTYTEAELRRLIDICARVDICAQKNAALFIASSNFPTLSFVRRWCRAPRWRRSRSACSLEQITRAFDQNRFSRLPVYHESLDNVIGFIHSKDVMPYLLHAEKFKLEDVLQPPMYVVDTARLEHVLRQMQKAKMHFGFVVDEHGGLEG